MTTQRTTGPEAAASGAETEALVRSLAALAGRLAELMIQETAVLAAKRSAAPEIQQEKTRLSALYADAWAKLKEDKEGFAALPAALRQDLRLQVERLAVVAEENAQALRLTHSATERVMSIVVRAVREQLSASAGYTRGCTHPARVAGGLGLALDRSF